MYIHGVSRKSARFQCKHNQTCKCTAPRRPSAQKRQRQITEQSSTRSDKNFSSSSQRNPAVPPVGPGVQAGQLVPRPPPPVVPRGAEPERAEQRHGHGLEQPNARAGQVVEHPELGGVEPQEHESEVARPRGPARQRPRRGAGGAAGRRLQQDADPREHEEDGRRPGLAGREAARAAEGVEEAALREGEEARGRLSRAAAGPREPRGGRAKRDAEGLVPPAAPEPGEAPVEDVVGEAAEEGRVVPQLGAAAEEGPEGEGARQLPQLHHHRDGGQYPGGAEQGAVHKELPGRQGGEEGRERDGDIGVGVFGPQNEVRIFHHQDAERVQDQAADDEGADLASDPRPAGDVAAVALRCGHGHGCQIDPRAREWLVGFREARHHRDRPVPAGAAEGGDEVEGPVQSGQERGVFWVGLPVVLVTLSEALCDVPIGRPDRLATPSSPWAVSLRRRLGTAIHSLRDGVCIAVLHGLDVRRPGMTVRGPIYSRLCVHRRPRPAPIDPLGVKLRPHEDEQGHVPDKAPRLHKTDGVAKCKVGAGGDEGLAQVVQEDGQHEQVAGLEQPWAAAVGYREVEDGQAKGDQDAVGDDQGLDGAKCELVVEMAAVDGADVVAQVCGQRAGQFQGHGES